MDLLVELLEPVFTFILYWVISLPGAVVRWLAFGMKKDFFEIIEKPRYNILITVLMAVAFTFVYAWLKG